MFCIRKDLINEELKDDIGKGFIFHYQKLSNKFIDKLLNHYQLEELSEFFYDSEPEFDDEEFNMYMDYRQPNEITGKTFWNTIINMDEKESKKESFRYSEKPHTYEELKAAYDKVVKMYDDYEKTRIEFNNWIEPYFEGNWGISQESVDSLGRDFLKYIRTFPKTIKNRLYVAKKENEIRIYFYGRDYWKVDYWFIFTKRKRRLK